jgi:hypothetical protein
MSQKGQGHVAVIEKKTIALQYDLTKILKSSDEDLKELLRLIKDPGITTPAEFALMIGILDALALQLNSFGGLRETLVNATRQIVGK